MRFDLPTSWRHGRGLAAQTGRILRDLGCAHSLLVTDGMLVEKGVVAPVVASLDDCEVEYTMCAEVTTEPTVSLFEKLVDGWDLTGFDSVLAVGGGSVIDVAKGLAVVAQFGGHIRDYAGFDRIPAPLLRKIVAVPTTAGTGSEISDGSVWIDEARQTKFLVLSTRICPTIALTDPEMTCSMPPRITATSGVDALTHAIESYVSVDAGVATELFSLRAIELIGAGLKKAYTRGDDLDAREAVQLGATMAMIAGMNAHMGLCHALAMPLCGLYPIPHGQACAMALPHVLEFNAEVAGAKVAGICEALAMVGTGNDAPGAARYREIEGLLAALGMTGRLRDFGYRDEHMDIIVRETLNSVQYRFNPRAASEEDLVRLVERLV
ncbi:MAG: iron-containing alcohol dehydrogenase [Thermoleophilia bacterium]|nr:iron-containing alcohol dehydrogenase [Thermoleophilia bacterium]